MARKRAGFYTLGIVVLLAGWQLLSTRYPAVILPSPAETLAALIDLARSGALAREVSTTLGRILVAFGITVLLGAGLGLAAGRRPELHSVLRPAVDLALSAPPISWVVIALVWFGTSGLAPIFTVVVVSTPVVFSTVYEGVHAIDPDLLGMARVYGVRGRTALEDIYLPALAPHLLAAIQLAASLAVRIGVMGELLGSDSGVGNAMALARTYLETAQVFAWVVVTVALLLLMEALVLRPIRHRAEGWRWQT